jgi:hypothetical protein
MSANGPNSAGTTSTEQPQPAPRPDVAMPPAPPGELPPEEVLKTKIVAEALERFGDDTEVHVVVEHIKSLGMDLSAEEVAAIRAELIERAQIPPGPDQPPPQGAQRADAGESPGHVPAANPPPTSARTRSRPQPPRPEPEPGVPPAPEPLGPLPGPDVPQPSPAEPRPRPGEPIADAPGDVQDLMAVSPPRRAPSSETATRLELEPLSGPTEASAGRAPLLNSED